jgi:hypothetical protein
MARRKLRQRLIGGVVISGALVAGSLGVSGVANAEPAPMPAGVQFGSVPLWGPPPPPPPPFWGPPPPPFWGPPPPPFWGPPPPPPPFWGPPHRRW